MPVGIGILVRLISCVEETSGGNLLRHLLLLLAILSLRRSHLLRHLLLLILLTRLGNRCCAVSGVATLWWIVAILRGSGTGWVGLSLGLHLDLLRRTDLILVVCCGCSARYTAWIAVTTVFAMVCQSNTEQGKTGDKEDAENMSVMPGQSKVVNRSKDLQLNSTNSSTRAEEADEAQGG
jgi:hypothetical protein